MKYIKILGSIFFIFIACTSKDENREIKEDDSFSISNELIMYLDSLRFFNEKGKSGISFEIKDDQIDSVSVTISDVANCHCNLLFKQNPRVAYKHNGQWIFIYGSIQANEKIDFPTCNSIVVDGRYLELKFSKKDKIFRGLVFE